MVDSKIVVERLNRKLAGLALFYDAFLPVWILCSRSSHTIVYTLLNVDHGIPEVWGNVYDVRELLNATVQMMDGKKLPDVDLGFKEKEVLKNAMKKIQGTEIEKLLKEYHVI